MVFHQYLNAFLAKKKFTPIPNEILNFRCLCMVVPQCESEINILNQIKDLDALV